MVLRIINVFMLCIFLLCIAVQYNDPDRFQWMLIYAFPAVITAMALFKRYTVFAAIGVVAFILGFIWWVPGATVSNPSHILTDLQMHEKGVEEAREAFGLLICGVWLIVPSVLWYRNRSSSLVE